MKKLMFAAAVAAGLAVFGDGIESANTVGYNTADFTGKTMVCVGAPFTTVGATTFKLGDFTAEGFDSSSDLLQTIDPDSADGVDFYVYLDAATYGASLAGWWTDDLSEQKNDEEFDVGTGFLGAFGAQEVVLRASGEVPQSPIEMDFTGKTMVIIPNPLPRTVTLSEITAEGFDSSSDLLQTIDPDTADGVDFYVYLDEATYGSALAGWWTDDLSESAGDVEIPAGEAMLGAFGAGEVILTFPGAL